MKEEQAPEPKARGPAPFLPIIALTKIYIYCILRTKALAP